MRRLFVDPGAPQRDALQEAAWRIRAGGVVAIPTDTLYGLAVDPFNPAAVTRVFAVKGRQADRALPLIASDLEQVSATIGALPASGIRLAGRFWPGPLTLVVVAPRPLLKTVAVGTGTVGVRVPAHDIARAICRATGRPVTATSANLSGRPATADPDDVEHALGDRIDLLIDAGPAPGGPPSTIVDVTGQPRLVRQGAVPWDDVLACLSHV